MEEIMLSIYVPTYYHEKYIAQALDSILMQKTQYTYEVLIGDDASGDKTPEIIKSYEAQYPGQFKVFYRQHNMYNSKCSNGQDLLKRCRGKYLICLEGDDYWISENKIEQQINFLETHPDYMAVAHNCIVVDENSQMKNEEYPECKDDEYTLKHLASDLLPGQTTTIMIRNFIKDFQFDTSLIFQNLMPWDRLLVFSVISYGRIYCIQKKMSAYRHITDSGKSYSATEYYSFEKSKKWFGALLEYAIKIGKEDSLWCAQLLYFHSLIEGMVHREAGFIDFISGIKKIPHKFSTLYYYFVRFFNKNILHKKVWY